MVIHRLSSVVAFIVLVTSVGAIGCSSNRPAVQSGEDLREFLPPFERHVNPFEVLDAEGNAYAHPFLGGFNIPRPQFLDINDDGIADLFVQENTDRVMFFENTGTAGSAAFSWRTDKYMDLDVGEWYRFADVDMDGDFDLLTEQPYSYLRFYANTGTPQEPRFELAADTLRDVDGKPIFSDRQNIPNVTDIDCDGLPDLFIGRLNGTVMRYEAVEAEIDQAPVFKLITERFEEIEIVAQFGQPGQMNQPPAPNIPNGSNLHGANSMAFADIDGDGDQDLFWGDFFEPGLLRIENTGSCKAPMLRGEPEPFPPPDPLISSGFNAPTFGDVDGDGDIDLLVGVLGGAFNPNRTVHAPLYFYEQGADSDFHLRSRSYLDQIDVGSESFPAIADLDGDGDLDLLVGNKISSNDSQSAVLARFENTGTASSPRFILRDSLVMHPSYHYAPAIADLDDDGLPDMLVGTWNDGVAYYRNTGAGFEMVEQRFVDLTRGSHTTPALVDIDGDGDLDLFIGETSGTINFYRNIGSRSDPSFELVSDEYLDIDVGRRSVPVFLDVDGDGDFDLIVGSETNGLVLFRNTGSSADPTFDEEGSFTDLVPFLAAPAFADLDNDGSVDLLVGGLSGGLTFFSGTRADPR